MVTRKKKIYKKEYYRFLIQYGDTADIQKGSNKIWDIKDYKYDDGEKFPFLPPVEPKYARTFAREENAGLEASQVFQRLCKNGRIKNGKNNVKVKHTDGTLTYHNQCYEE